MSTIKKQATGSVLWSAVERFSVQGVQYVINILIARILLPSDYGVIAMLNIFLALFQTVIDGGFGNALIRKKTSTEADFSTVFYFNFAVSVGLYALLYFSAPFIALFYEVPDLEQVAKVVGITLIINSLGLVQQTRLAIALNFKAQAIASFLAVIGSGTIGVVMAYQGYGVWALVWHTLINNSLRVALLWTLARWIPTLVFSMDSFRALFSFGSKLLISALMHTIYTNLYTLIIGKKFAATELGFFNRAANLAQFPSSNFTNIIVRAVYPIQCRMQDDPEQLHRMFLAYLRMASFIIFPIMVALCVMAEPLFIVVLTDKWLPAAPIFQLLCIAYMWDPVMKINHNMLNVKGRSDYFLRAEIYKKIVAVAILLSTLPFGVMAMCAGLVVYAFVDMLIITHYVKKVTDISTIDQAKSLLPVALLTLTMGALIFFIMFLMERPLLKLGVGVAAGVVYYGAASFIFKFKEFDQLLAIIRNRS